MKLICIYQIEASKQKHILLNCFDCSNSHLEKKMKSSNKTSQSKPIHNTYITNKIIIITQNKCLAQIFAAKQTPKDIIRVKMMQSPFNKEQKLMLKLFQNIREPLVTLPASSQVPPPTITNNNCTYTCTSTIILISIFTMMIIIIIIFTLEVLAIYQR